MHGLVDQLRRLNRKERFYLVGRALGNSSFALSDEFRDAVGSALTVTIPHDAFVAMDYHLNWIQAALLFTSKGATTAVAHELDSVVAGNQEDIDLLVAFDEGEQTHIILIEAKGATGWNNKQMISKANRLGSIFGQEGTRWPNVQPAFILASPRQPKQLRVDLWPEWMTVDEKTRWIELRLPADVERVTRCSPDEVISRFGTHWKLAPAGGVQPSDEADF